VTELKNLEIELHVRPVGYRLAQDPLSVAASYGSIQEEDIQR